MVTQKTCGGRLAQNDRTAVTVRTEQNPWTCARACCQSAPPSACFNPILTSFLLHAVITTRDALSLPPSISIDNVGSPFSSHTTTRALVRSRHRWCPTYHDYFAVSTSNPAKGAVIHVHNVTYTHAQPTVFQIAPRPLCVRSFDFLATRGIPRIVAAVGRDVVVFYIGVDS